MRVPSWLLPAEILLLVSSLQLFPLTSAAPSVNIGIQASFDSAPYLVELLEAAADEKESVYYKILDRVAEGYFDNASTDKELYDRFLRLLKDDSLITNSDSLSSFELALSVHNAAPRIEAHYQYYKTTIEPLLEQSAAKDCEAWLEFTGRQFCSPQLEKEDATIKGLALDGSQMLPFDRSFGASIALPAIIYADITTTEFKRFHLLISEAARNGRITYRVRHKPSKGERKPLEMSGWGAELTLKRTDYIVIDDRQTEDKKSQDTLAENSMDADDEMADLKPLSSSELEDLSMRTASYVMSSEFPLKRLSKVTQDFPKYSSFLATNEPSQTFVKEHTSNRESFLPAGYNVLWINGVQYDARKMDAFSLLDHMRRERKQIAAFKDLGFQNAEAIQLLTHPAIAEAQTDAETTRYDWRDKNEGGNVIIWMNDIEKDKRYEDWAHGLMALLQRTYPGQLPMVRRDIHNMIIPVDFSEPRSVTPIVETIQDFVKRRIPVRFGLVPLSHTDSAGRQGRVAYHIYETYGLGALMKYLEQSMAAKQMTTPHEDTFKTVLEGRTAKAGLEAMPLKEVLESSNNNDKLEAAFKYLTRLGAKAESAPLFVNGVPIKNDDDWLQAFSQRVSTDLRWLQRGVFEGTFAEDEWLPSIWLNSSSLRRNALVIPEDEKEIKLMSLPDIFTPENEEIIQRLPIIPVSGEAEGSKSQLVVIGDFDTNHGLRLILEAIKFREEHNNVEILFIPNGNSPVVRSPRILSSWPKDVKWTIEMLQALYQKVEALLTAATDVAYEGSDFWPEAQQLVEAFGFRFTQSGLVLNGRKVGPIPEDETFVKEDFETLYDFELRKRIGPAMTAIEHLGYSQKLKTALDSAKLCSILSLSTVSEMPEGIFELPPPIRTRLYYEWNSTETAITIGDNSTAAIQIFAVLDPASEVAQRWVPLLKVLSEMDGIFLRLFMNPKEKLQELPVKRFYRYALDTKPSFDSDGAVSSPGVKFEGVPRDALLTAAMDVPPAWLVAPKDSVHDLDNVKLSSLAPGINVEAKYELEHILIEGHSRDSTAGIPPRGAQLALSTAKDPHYADTIIMANLGYFQFKANPGYYNISLMPGLSQKIFNIDSVGAVGYDPVAGDETTEVTLMSFSGVTLYPRLSRKPGMEDEDVLGTPKAGATGAAADIVSKGAGFVDGLLSKAGVQKPLAGKYASQALALLSKSTNAIKAGGVSTTSQHADINIFSVASGHLYERMLNIMMVSVMRHTNHTVKFWFVEQFLSSSFKAFLPTLAKEYGFQYEMVTYKWPHWLRAQKEKQREIWGYKILFLDVLFPLDLDKVIFVDADQIVRTDMYELVQHDLKGAPYGFTPMCDSRTEMEGFRFWKQGYWKNFLRGLPYHISALYVVDLQRFRQIAAGDRLRQQYHQLSADPNSLSNLDQDLPNNMQMVLPIHSLPQEWLWCETWCSDESLKDAKTIDLCNNPQTKEPKLERARRQVPEWTEYDDEIAALAKRTAGEVPSGDEQQKIQQAEKDKDGRPVEEEDVKPGHKRDEL